MGAEYQCDCDSGFTGDLCELPRFELLGVLPGFDVSIALVLSDDGQVIYGDDDDFDTSSRVPFRWSRDSGKQLFAPPGFEVSSTSNDGGVAVGSRPNADGVRRAFRWSAASGFIDLGMVPEGDSTSTCRASTTNADGSVVAGTCDVPSGTVAFRWTAATGMWRLPMPFGVSLSARLAPSSMSSDGGTIVGTLRDGSVNDAFLWTSAGTLRIGPADPSAPPTITAEGSVVVGLSGDGVLPFRWTSASGMVQIESFPPCRVGLPYDATDDANTVAMTCQTGSDLSAGLWTEERGYRPMIDVLRELGAAVPGDWSLVYSIRVSGDGGTVLGLAVNAAGAYEPWIARL